MLLFTVKNIGDKSIEIVFTVGKKQIIRPNTTHTWFGIQDDINKLQREIDKGDLELRIFDFNFPLDDCIVDWKKEGF